MPSLVLVLIADFDDFATRLFAALRVNTPSSGSLRQVQDLSQSTRFRHEVCEKSGLSPEHVNADVFVFYGP